MEKVKNEIDSNRNFSDNKIPIQKTNEGKNRKLILILIITSCVALIAVIGIILMYFLSPKKEKNEGVEEAPKENIKENRIEASYKITAGKEMLFLNPKEIGLKDEEFDIEEIESSSINTNNLRLLKILSVNNGKYIPTYSGILSAKINFKKELSSLDNLFKGNKELMKINLSHLNMDEIISMKSTFSGCLNLNEVNFNGTNTSKLINMEKTFENCTEIKNINLSPLNANKLENTENIFSGCNKLETINLDSFKKISDNMFNGIQSIPNIIANELISNEISKIFNNLFSVNIIIILSEKNECTIGEKEKCKTCSKKIKSNCLTCNEGYFLPYHELDNKKCLPCNIIEHCSSCFGEKDYVICSTCELGYKLLENKCQEIEEYGKEKEIEKGKEKEDEKGKEKEFGKEKLNENEKSKENESGIKENEIAKEKEKDKIIKEIENEKEIEKDKNIKEVENEKEMLCDIEGCLECFGSSVNKYCSKCQNGYNQINFKCIKETCLIGLNEKCSSCKTEIGKEKECATCNDGYYISETGNSFLCQKCSINYCKTCAIYLGKEICLECQTNLIGLKNIDGMIELCTCKQNQKVYEGFCVENGNWIEMEYNVVNPTSNNQLMNTFYTNINLNELDVYLNNSLISLTKDSGQWDKPIYFKVNENGLYTFKINIKKTLYSMEWMFTNLVYIKSIKFLPGFDSSKVTSMEMMFSCTQIEHIDMKYLDTSNLISLKEFLYSSISINSIVLSNFNTSKSTIMTGMFEKTRKLNFVDLSSFDTSNVQNCLIMFHDIPNNCTIMVSNKFVNCLEQIPFENKIINIDELACNKYENCEKCEGSKETLICVKCKPGYEFINNECTKQKCQLGENEKCLKCKNIFGKEEECLECNEGYYLPSNAFFKTKCYKCQIEGCKKCNNISGKCEECKYNYEPIKEESTGIIKNCELKCEIGNGDKCLTCQKEIGKKNQCLSCNIGYKLIKGKCKKIENSFIGIYDVKSISKFTRIMCVSENNIKLSDFDMYVNGKKVTPYIDQGRWRSWMDEDYVAYVFPSLGPKEVKIIFNKTLTDMKYMFVDCYDLVSIEFNEAFDTSHVLCMYYMFDSCDSLKYINVSSFNTSLVGDMEGMFSGCDSLTSLDLSNFETKNVFYMHYIFSYSMQLSYLDISSFDTTYLAAGAWMFEDLAEVGTVIIGNKFNRISSLPKGWKIKNKN